MNKMFTLYKNNKPTGIKINSYQEMASTLKVRINVYKESYECYEKGIVIINCLGKRNGEIYISETEIDLKQLYA